MTKVAILDIDGTLHDGFSTPNAISVLIKQGLVGNQLANDFNKLINQDLRRYSNYLDWCKDLDSIILKVFTGKNKLEMKKALINYRQELEANLFPFTIPLINFLRQNQFEIIFLTGSLDFVAEIFADIFEVSYANIITAKLVEQNGNYINEYAPGLYMNKTDKRDVVLGLSEKFNLSLSIVVADAVSDTGMFPLVGKGFLMMDDKTQKTLIDESERLKAVIVDKNLPNEKILTIFSQNLP